LSDAGEPLDAAAASDAQRDACAGERCLPSESCDEDHPCFAPDTVCSERACKADPAAPAAAWQRSAWSGRAGLVHDDDATIWCTPEIASGAIDASHPAGVRSELQRSLLDGTVQHEFVSNLTAQRVRFQCFADATLSGTSTMVTSAWSSDSDKDIVRARCPRERPYAAFARCQTAANGKPPYVYAGPTCGDGSSGLSAKAALRGQLLGDRYKLNEPGKPLFNNTGKALVIGTDLGFQFLAQGRLYLGFGDTWDNDLGLTGPAGLRGSILSYTHDFDPSDANGITFEGWDTAPDRPDVAREVIPCVHDQSGNSEFTAIGTSGFGLTEAGKRYRFLWFAAIKKWDPFTSNESTLAWSENEGVFARGDQASGLHAPRWPFDSFFGPGAIWVDREHGYLYFYGVRTYQAGSPVRVARVRASLSAVRDHLQYEYWTGSAWQRPDAKDEYALARLADPAANLLPGGATQNTRPELSVAYDPYVDRFIMLAHNDATPFMNEPQNDYQLWEAKKPEGPWKLVDTRDNLTLKANTYGPYTSDHLLADGGRDVYFALSDWDLVPILGQPYVVGLWSMQLERNLRPGCTP
jgi:hypothetical protein